MAGFPPIWKTTEFVLECKRLAFNLTELLEIFYTGVVKKDCQVRGSKILLFYKLGSQKPCPNIGRLVTHQGKNKLFFQMKHLMTKPCYFTFWIVFAEICAVFTLLSKVLLCWGCVLLGIAFKLWVTIEIKCFAAGDLEYILNKLTYTAKWFYLA